MTKQEALERLQVIVDNSSTADYMTLEIQANDWENYGKSRTYLQIAEAATVSKHYKVKKYGYIDNKTGEYFPEKYGDIRNNFNFGGNSF